MQSMKHSDSSHSVTQLKYTEQQCNLVASISETWGCGGSALLPPYSTVCTLMQSSETNRCRKHFSLRCVSISLWSSSGLTREWENTWDYGWASQRCVKVPHDLWQYHVGIILRWHWKCTCCATLLRSKCILADKRNKILVFLKNDFAEWGIGESII